VVPFGVAVKVMAPTVSMSIPLPVTLPDGAEMVPKTVLYRPRPMSVMLSAEELEIFPKFPTPPRIMVKPSSTAF
jgi:hypothetical protein